MMRKQHFLVLFQAAGKPRVLAPIPTERKLMGKRQIPAAHDSLATNKKSPAA